jgi:PleD family two-component response regulator
LAQILQLVYGRKGPDILSSSLQFHFAGPAMLQSWGFYLRRPGNFRRPAAARMDRYLLMDPKKPRESERPVIIILVFHELLRHDLVELLEDNGYAPRLAANPQEVIRHLRKNKCATVFIDCEALSLYGAGICSKIKLACRYCRVVLFCDKALEAHRQIIKDAMEIGIYACLLPPYADWEILTMVSYYPRL